LTFDADFFPPELFCCQTSGTQILDLSAGPRKSANLALKSCKKIRRGKYKKTHTVSESQIFQYGLPAFLLDI
jgi:hypothetical protein